MNFVTKIVTLLFLCWPLLSMADLQKEMLKAIDDIVSTSNYSAPEVYKGQKAGYATGGGITIRNKVLNLNPVTATAPRIEGGCGGIDIYTGGLSFVDSEQLIKTLKSIGSSSAGYAFMLSLESLSPQISSTLKQLQTWANNVNAANINSCEMAAGLVSSVWPQNDRASRHICETMGTEFQLFKSHIEARHRCENREERQKSRGEFQDKNPHVEFDYNVAWRAIQNLGIIAKDEQQAELLLTLLGTIVVLKEKVEVYASEASEESFMRSLLEGGPLNIYRCDEAKKCLILTKKQITISPHESWTGKIEKLLLSIQQKIITDEELTNEEQELLVKTRIPLYKYMAILTAYKKSVCPIEIKQMAEVVSLDLLSKYLKESLDAVRRSCLWFKQQVSFSDKIDAYLESLEYVERKFNEYEARPLRLMEQENSIFHRMDMLEKYIKSELHL